MKDHDSESSGGPDRTRKMIADPESWVLIQAWFAT
jgi:hypothetical protein